MDKLYSLSQFGARVGRSTHPLHVIDRAGTFPANRTATDQQSYTEADLLRFLGIGDDFSAGLTVVHGCVSSRGQRR